MFYCPICNRNTITPEIYKKTWKNVDVCGICTSFPRHRFAFYIYKKFFLDTEMKINLLHFAPEMSLYNVIQKNKNICYYTCDYNIEAYKYIPNIQKQDGMKLSYDDNFFDFIIHNHVLEHVENDKKFIKENLRVLKPNGIIIASFPYEKKLENLEVPTHSKEENIKLYGQYDHVRRYGYNWIEKLSDDSYKVEEIKMSDYLSEDEFDKAKLNDTSVFVKITHK